jgi:hypothetical protein
MKNVLSVMWRCRAGNGGTSISSRWHTAEYRLLLDLFVSGREDAGMTRQLLARLLAEPFIAPGSLDGYPGTMRQVLHNIEAGKLTDELRRRGIPPGQRVRVVVEPVEDDEPPITALNAAGGAFDWLADEPDLYSDADLVERYRP